MWVVFQHGRGDWQAVAVKAARPLPPTGWGGTYMLTLHTLGAGGTKLELHTKSMDEEMSRKLGETSGNEERKVQHPIIHAL